MDDPHGYKVLSVCCSQMQGLWSRNRKMDGPITLESTYIVDPSVCAHENETSVIRQSLEKGDPDKIDKIPELESVVGVLFGI